MKREFMRQKEEQEREDDSDDEVIHDIDRHNKTKGRICGFKLCCKLPEQKRPIDKYQINLAKLRIKQEIYPISNASLS